MRRFRFTSAPRDLSRRRVKLDNIALIPASLLPCKEHWQHIADGLPSGEILIVLPKHEKSQRTARFVASQLTQNGKHVWLTLPPKSF